LIRQLVIPVKTGIHWLDSQQLSLKYINERGSCTARFFTKELIFTFRKSARWSLSRNLDSRCRGNDKYTGRE